MSEAFTEVDLFKEAEIKESEKVNGLQMQMMYIIYMIVGSYFRSCSCANHVRETNLFLYYQDMRQGDQISKESKVEREFLQGYHGYLDTFADLVAEVHFQFGEKESKVYFLTGLEEVVATVRSDGTFSFDLNEE